MTTATSRTGGFFSPKILLIVVAVIAALYGAHRIGAGPWLTNALDWIRGLGPLAPIAFIAIYIVACVAFLPGSILTIGAGVIFGVVRGSIYVSIAATLGATAAFLVGRYLARDWVSAKLEGNPKFKAIDDAVGKEGWKIVLLTRLSPVFPFNLLNYAYGLTSVTSARLRSCVVGRDDSRHDSLRVYRLAEWRRSARGRGQRQTNAGRMGAHGGRLYRDSRGGSVRNTNRRAGAARKDLRDTINAIARAET